jgi:hypothetical protein
VESERSDAESRIIAYQRGSLEFTDRFGSSIRVFLNLSVALTPVLSSSSMLHS